VRELPSAFTVNAADGSLAAQVLAMMRVACPLLVKVQVTVAPAASVMLPGELLLSQVALACAHPLGSVSDTE